LRRVLSTYGFALIAIVAAVLLRALLDPVIGDDLPLVTLFGAVAAVVWFGGFGPAIVATILGYLACAWLFIPPRGVLLFDVRTIVGLIAYLFTCTLIIAIGHAMRIARQRATERGELLRVTLGSVGDAVITTDTEGRVTYVNAVAESLTGWTSAEAEGRPLEDVFRIVNEQDVHSVENPAIRALRDGTVVGLANHTVLIARDGVRRSIDDSAAPIKDESGRVSGCVLIFRDITEQRRAEQREAARVRDARMLSSIVATSDDAIISKTLDGIIQSWNDAAERLFGYTAEQAVGRHITLIIPPERIAEEDQIIASLRAGRRVDHFETERRRSDGTTVLVSLTVSPLKDDAGNVVGASKIVRDITRQRHAEAEREKFVTLIETSTDFIGICDLEATPIYINRAGLKMVGLDGMEEARRVRIADFFFRKIRPGSWTSSFRACATRVTPKSTCASVTSGREKRAGWPTRC
jgi:PAS domain S-box-containing protein